MKKLKGNPYKSSRGRVPMPPPTRNIPDKRRKLQAKAFKKEMM